MCSGQMDLWGGVLIWWESSPNGSLNAPPLVKKQASTLPYCHPSLMHCYLLLQSTVEDEDKHALEGIEDGEEVSHDDSVLIDKQKAKSPRQPQ